MSDSNDGAKAVKTASEETARRIERYLEQNKPELAQVNKMNMHDEQFEKLDSGSPVAQS